MAHAALSTELQAHLSSREASSAYPLTSIIQQRWSPRAFDAAQDISLSQIGSLLEAARWSASCFNAQPWRFVVGSKTHSPETHQAIFNTLVEWNQQWSEPAPLLILSVARTTFPLNGKPNAHAAYDVGQATTSMILQAQSMGIFAHSMAGFDMDAAMDTFAIPRNEYQALAVTAFGYPALPETLSDDGMRESETAPRERQKLSEMAFARYFGQPFSGVYSQ